MKISNGVSFRESTHEYRRLDTGEKLVSVTTVLNEFSPAFDTEKMSRLCAERDVREGHTGLTVAERQAELKALWKKKNEDVSEEGTRRHLLMETMLKELKSPAAMQKELGLSDEDRGCLEYGWGLNLHKRDSIFVEDLLSDFGYGIAGQSDIVTIHGGKVHIDDWKFNSKKLTWDSYNGQTMSFPLHRFKASKLHTYMMQASIYMFLKCRQTGLKPGRLRVHHYLDGVWEMHEFDYMEEDVFRLLEYRSKAKKIPVFHKEPGIYQGMMKLLPSGDIAEVVEVLDSGYRIMVGRSESFMDQGQTERLMAPKKSGGGLGISINGSPLI